MKYLITKWQLKWTKWLRFPVVFEESAILPANVRNLKWKCWLWGVQETKCYDIYTTRHGKASPFQLWWSVRGAIPIFDVNQCSLLGSMFCVCLHRLGLAVTGARLKTSERGYRDGDRWSKLQALFYDILPLEEGAGKRCSECGSEGDERVKARPRMPPEKDRRDPAWTGRQNIGSAKAVSGPRHGPIHTPHAVADLNQSETRSAAIFSAVFGLTCWYHKNLSLSLSHTRKDTRARARYHTHTHARVSSSLDIFHL